VHKLQTNRQLHIPEQLQTTHSGFLSTTIEKISLSSLKKVQKKVKRIFKQ
jgi:hypothetical protein